MCNINILYKTIEQSDLPFLQVITQQSFNNNKDAEGFLSENLYWKQDSKIWIEDHPEVIGSRYIAFHERFSTHGNNKRPNQQPIIEDRVIMLHNGVMDLYDKHNIKSDSKLFAKRVNNLMQKGKDLEASIVKMIESVTGNKSMLFYDRDTTDLYYYKNEDTNFYIARGQDGDFFASTNRDNCLMAEDRYGYDKPVSVISDTLFKIVDGVFEVVKSGIDDATYYGLFSDTKFSDTKFNNFSYVNTGLEKYTPNFEKYVPKGETVQFPDDDYMTQEELDEFEKLSGEFDLDFVPDLDVEQDDLKGIWQNNLTDYLNRYCMFDNFYFDHDLDTVIAILDKKDNKETYRTIEQYILNETDIDPFVEVELDALAMVNELNLF